MARPIVFIGIDNGVTGSVGAVVSDGRCSLMPMPVREVEDYTRSVVHKIHRIDVDLLALTFTICKKIGDCMVVMERPMINPRRWNASLSAIRALEATIITLERMNLPYTIIDSRIWQKDLLPRAKDLKKAAVRKARKLYPKLKNAVTEQTADGILLAHWLKTTTTIKGGTDDPQLV